MLRHSREGGNPEALGGRVSLARGGNVRQDKGGMNVIPVYILHSGESRNPEPRQTTSRINPWQPQQCPPESTARLLSISSQHPSEEFERGDVLQGAEKLWGAAAHAVMSVAQERDWEHESHRSLKNAVMRLAHEYDDQLINAGFLAAEKFHRHFYRDSMEDWEREADRPLVHDFVRRVLAL